MDEEKKKKDAGPGPAPGAEASGKAEAGVPDGVRAELEALREKAAKADEYLDLARRARADFINYQDRVRRDRQDWTRQAVGDFLRDFLPALDGFAMARSEDPKFIEAVRLIEKEFLRVLAKNGVVPVETAGKTFDPVYHEAVAVEEVPGKPEGTILEEVRRGWMVDGRVLRPASVRISRPSPP